MEDEIVEEFLAKTCDRLRAERDELKEEVARMVKMITAFQNENALARKLCKRALHALGES